MSSLILGVLPGIVGSAYPASTEMYIVFKSGSTIVGRSAATGTDTVTDTDLAVILEALIGNNVVVYVAPGNYNMDTQCDLTGKDSWSIIGAGAASRINMTNVNAGNDGTFLDGLRVDTCNDVALKDFYINGNGSNGYAAAGAVSTDDKGSCIHVVDCTNVEISGVEATDAYFHGIFATHTMSGLNIHDCHLHGNGFRNCHLHGDDTDAQEGNRFASNECHDSGAIAAARGQPANTGVFIVFQNTAGNIVSGNVIYDEAGAGMEIGGTSYSVVSRQSIVSDNYIARSGTHGMFFQDGFKDCQISSNIVVDSGGIGIYVDTCTGLTFLGNQINGSTSYGFSFVDSGKISVLGGSVINGSSVGFLFDGSGAQQYSITVSGVVIDSGGGIGLQMQDCRDCVIANNIITNWDNSGSSDAINLASAAINNVITGNVIRSSAGTGRAINIGGGCDENTVALNQCNQNGSGSCRIDGDDCVIRDNYFSGGYQLSSANGTTRSSHNNKAPSEITAGGIDEGWALKEVLTSSGAIGTMTQYVELDHTSVTIAATIANSNTHAGVFTAKATTEPGGGGDHTVTLSSGTWDGSNNVATFQDINDKLVVLFDDDGSGVVLSKSGVTLS